MEIIALLLLTILAAQQTRSLGNIRAEKKRLPNVTGTSFVDASLLQKISVAASGLKAILSKTYTTFDNKFASNLNVSLISIQQLSINKPNSWYSDINNAYYLYDPKLFAPVYYLGQTGVLNSGFSPFKLLAPINKSLAEIKYTEIIVLPKLLKEGSGSTLGGVEVFSHFTDKAFIASGIPIGLVFKAALYVDQAKANGLPIGQEYNFAGSFIAAVLDGKSDQDALNQAVANVQSIMSSVEKQMKINKIIGITFQAVMTIASIIVPVAAPAAAAALGATAMTVVEKAVSASILAANAAVKTGISVADSVKK